MLWKLRLAGKADDRWQALSERLASWRRDRALVPPRFSVISRIGFQ